MYVEKKKCMNIYYVFILGEKQWTLSLKKIVLIKGKNIIEVKFHIYLSFTFKGMIIFLF